MANAALETIIKLAAKRRSVLLGSAAILAASAKVPIAHAQPATSFLPSWNDGPAKQTILDFVRATTSQSSKDFVAPEDRIATFDQDGTLWTEHPLYTQAFFALYRVHAMAPQNPKWQSEEPFKSVLSNNPAALGKLTEEDWFQIVEVTHSGMSTEAFNGFVTQWLKVAKHPRFERPFTDLVYQPMREVMNYLRANGFKTYIVTGGGQDFVRAFAQQIYGIPPEQVIGSSGGLKYVMTNGVPELIKTPKLFFNDNDDGKAFGIYRTIGKRPCAAFGNTSGDQQMLEWTGASAGASLKMLVLHDDAAREYAYGPAGGLPDTKVGAFSNALMTEAKARNWPVISMKNDWNQVFAFKT